MGLELSVGCGGVSAAITHVRAFPSVRALVIIFSLICRESLGAGGIAACVWPVSGVTQEMT
jgi:hypothetical protein